MQNEKVEDWSYWSQRRDSLKRYPKHESLNPTWYTDNIYSNHSLDLDDTGNLIANLTPALLTNHRQLRSADNSDQFDDDCMIGGVGAGIAENGNASSGNIFCINSRSRHATGNLHEPSAGGTPSYKYPKSRSCCFGGGYDAQPPIVELLPKSSSFGAAAAAAAASSFHHRVGGRGAVPLLRQHSAPPYDHELYLHPNQPHHPQSAAKHPVRFECCSRNHGTTATATATAVDDVNLRRAEDDLVVERLTYRRSFGPATTGNATDTSEFERRQLESDMSYVRQRDDAAQRHSRMMYMLDETYPPRRRPKIDIDRMRNKTDYIRNEWLSKTQAASSKAQTPHQYLDADLEPTHDYPGAYNFAPSAGAFYDPMSDHNAGLSTPELRRRERQMRQKRQHRQRFSSSTAYESDAEQPQQYTIDNAAYSETAAQLEHDFESEAAAVDEDYFSYMRQRHQRQQQRSHHQQQRPLSTSAEQAAAAAAAQSKSALEVQAPSRFDDTSSDSTDVDLDDFNFDFEKYWENLDKTNSSYDIDIQNNNTYNNLGRAVGGRKVKDVNVARYNNGRRRALAAAANAAAASEYQPEPGALFLGKHSHLLESLLAPSLDSSDNQEYQEHLALYNDPAKLTATTNVGASNNNINNNNDNNNMDNGAGYLSDSEFMSRRPPRGAAASSTTSPFHRTHKIYPGETSSGAGPRLPTYPPPPPPPPILKQPTSLFLPVATSPTSPRPARRQPTSSSNPFSLINNIFSIYKPKKYSPLNCNTPGMRPVPPAKHPHHQQHQHRHLPQPPQSLHLHQHHHQPHHHLQHSLGGGIAKKLNVPSTIRPLGSPANDFMTSLKRPLLVTPSPSAATSPCVEQPHFKIIPEKTGLKISPLYRFDYDSGERKYLLRSTARPLMMTFPN